MHYMHEKYTLKETLNSYKLKNDKRMKKTIFFSLLLTLLVGFQMSCKDDKAVGYEAFDPSKPIEILSFYPDSGGIATPMIISGKNFGSDTTGMKVFFEDTLGMRHEAGLVSSNGSMIYAMVPKLTYLKELKIVIERKESATKIMEGIAQDHFFYKTQTTVSTVVGKPEPDNDNVPTMGGEFTSATLSAPFAICLDDEDNIFIVERSFNAQSGNSGQAPRDDQGNGVQSNIVLADTKNENVLVMKYGAAFSNAPAFSDETGNEAVYVPEDAGLYYYSMNKALSYAPRRRSLITDEETKNVVEGNWKYSFVVNKVDKMVYTVMWKGQLVRFNPSTRSVELLLSKVIPDLPNFRGETGTNAYCVFSPLEPNMLYICQEDYNIISRVDISKLDDKDQKTYKGEMYAGKSILEGPVGGRGWEDGLLENARFFGPKQIVFTADGKLYIADSSNHCIRVIDTTAPKDKATVSTAIGLPGSAGFQDGGPELAKFNFPSGVAVSADGEIIYVADKKNHVIRKLSVE